MSNLANELRKAAKAKKKDKACAEHGDKVKKAHIVTALTGLMSLQRKLR